MRRFLVAVAWIGAAGCSAGEAWIVSGTAWNASGDDEYGFRTVAYVDEDAKLVIDFEKGGDVVHIEMPYFRYDHGLNAREYPPGGVVQVNGNDWDPGNGTYTWRPKSSAISGWDGDPNEIMVLVSNGDRPSGSWSLAS